MTNKNPGAIALLMVTTIIFPGLLLFSSCSKKGAVSPDQGYYTCSMHPQVIQHEPGNCPICGMKLTFVPAKKKKAESAEKKDQHGHDHKEEKKESPHFHFSLAENLLKNARVYTVPVTKKVFKKKSLFSGHVDYNEDPNRLVIINTKYDGWIERLYVSKEGQRVRRGALLMGVYSQKILSAKEEYITTWQTLKRIYLDQGKSEADLKKDRTLQAARRKLLYLDIPAGQISHLEKTGVAERRTYYRSPISGVIVKKNVLQGDHIKSGQELFRIANLGRLWIFIHIFEKDLQFVKKGQRVSISSNAYPDKKFPGRIDLIYPFFDMKTKDAKVRIVVNNPRQMLKPGMFVNVAVDSGFPGKSLVIPDNAIIYSGEKNYVFVSLGEGEFEVRPVAIKIRSGSEAVISRGLKEKELIVANGQFLLDSEASLKEALQKGKAGGHQH